jgi:hypothetical protein
LKFTTKKSGKTKTVLVRIDQGVFPGVSQYIAMRMREQAAKIQSDEKRETETVVGRKVGDSE